MDAAIDEGIRFFDTAETYSDGESELWLGQALKGRRQHVIIASKFNPASEPALACDSSLRRLHTDYIDVYFMHFPNPSIPIGETLGKLHRLIREGKVRTIGSSNFSGQQIEEADQQARASNLPRFEYAQNRYSLVERQLEDDLIPVCHRLSIGFIAFQPLGGGLLTGKYQRHQPPPPSTRLSRARYADRFLNDAMFDKVDALRAFAAKNGVSLIEVALGALASMPQVSIVVAGATTPEQVRANAQASRWSPTKDQLAELRQLTASDRPAFPPR